MTIFARRTIQRFVDGLAGSLNAEQLATIVGKLNLEDAQSLATEWEVAVLHALAPEGQIIYEPSLGGPRPADLLFRPRANEALEVLADVTCVSDRGLEEKYPITEMIDIIRRKSKQLGIRGGAFHYTVGSQTVGDQQKVRVKLRMPERNALHGFVESRIVSELRQLAAHQSEPWELHLRGGNDDIRIAYTPGARYGGGSYPAYRNPTAIANNPLYSALDQKRKQLGETGYAGSKGIIVCDGGCQALTNKVVSWHYFSRAQIVDEFFRHTTSVSFVLLVWVEDLGRRGATNAFRLCAELRLNPRAASPLPEQIAKTLRALPMSLPDPVENGENARLTIDGLGRRREQGFWSASLWGGYEMSRSKIRLSARGIMELLAGRRSAIELERDHGIVNPFEAALREGMTIRAVKIGRLENDDDDWLEFHIAPDPAISRFTVPNATPNDPAADGNMT